MLARVAVFDDLAVALIANTVMFLAFPMSLFLLGVVQADEKEFLRTRLAKLLRR